MLIPLSANETLKVYPEHPYYPDDKYSEELGLVQYEQVEQDELRKQWTLSTTLWMLLMAVMLWIITYLIVVTATMCFDLGFRSVSGVTGIIHWFNGTTAVVAEERVSLFKMI